MKNTNIHMNMQTNFLSVFFLGLNLYSFFGTANHLKLIKMSSLINSSVPLPIIKGIRYPRDFIKSFNLVNAQSGHQGFHDHVEFNVNLSQ